MQPAISSRVLRLGELNDLQFAAAKSSVIIIAAFIAAQRVHGSKRF